MNYKNNAVYIIEKLIALFGIKLEKKISIIYDFIYLNKMTDI